MSWLDHIDDQVNELLAELARIADALERLVKLLDERAL